jgi:hypothetical protein
MASGGARWRKSLVEAPDVRIAVSAGGSNEAYSRQPLAPREAQHKVVEHLVARLHRESAAAHRNDLPHRHRDSSITSALSHRVARGHALVFNMEIIAEK